MCLVTTRMTQFGSYGLLQQNTRSINQSIKSDHLLKLGFVHIQFVMSIIISSLKQQLYRLRREIKRFVRNSMLIILPVYTYYFIYLKSPFKYVLISSRPFELALEFCLLIQEIIDSIIFYAVLLCHLY